MLNLKWHSFFTQSHHRFCSHIQSSVSSLLCEVVSCTIGGLDELESSLNNCKASLTSSLVTQVIDSCKDEAPTRRLLRFFSWSLKNLNHDLKDEDFNHAICLFAQKKDYTAIDILLSDLKRAGRVMEGHTFSIVAEALVKMDREDEALGLFKNLDKYKCSHDQFTVAAIVTALCSKGHARKAEGVVFHHKEKISVMSCIYRSLLFGWSIQKNTKEARRILKEMKSDRTMPDLFCYNTFLKCLCEQNLIKNPSGLVPEALNVMMEMRSYEISPNSVSYNILLSCLGRTRRVKESCRILEMMKRSGCRGDWVSYYLVAKVLFLSGRFGKGRMIVDEMIEEGLVPDRKFYYDLIGVLCGVERTNYAVELFEKMKRSSLGGYGPVYDVLIPKLCKGGDFEMGRKLWEEAIAMNLELRCSIDVLDPSITEIFKPSRKIDNEIPIECNRAATHKPKAKGKKIISVRSARQVINALNAEGPDIDIILTEVDLPMAKGMKMLKYVTRDKELRRIPVIMMSAQDEVSVVVKCLRLGATDYLVKPLRTNELLNLWTHIWRRRRMLGLAEKQILNFDFDLATSDLSDRNTNSTTFFSDDTDDITHRNTNPELDMPHQEDVSSVAAATAMDPLAAADSLQFQPNVQFIDENQNGPKKCKLKIGESSAFFTYCKSNALKGNFQAPAQQLRREVNPLSTETDQLVSIDHCETGNACTSYSQGDDYRSSASAPDSRSMDMSSSPQTLRFPQQMSHDEENISQVLEHPRDDSRLNVAGLRAQTNYPFYMSGVMNQVLVPPSADFYHKNPHEVQNYATAATMPEYSHLHHFSLAPGMLPPFPYYSPNICLQPGQMPSSHPWPSLGSPSSTEVKLSKADRREAALIKFRQKRKERCFDKKIRYANRKQLAEKRPRVRGQFVRKVNGVDVDLNGQPSSTGHHDNDNNEML